MTHTAQHAQWYLIPVCPVPSGTSRVAAAHLENPGQQLLETEFQTRKSPPGEGPSGLIW